MKCCKYDPSGLYYKQVIVVIYDRTHFGLNINVTNCASRSLNDDSRSTNGSSRSEIAVTLQIVMSLKIVVYHHNMFMVEATSWVETFEKIRIDRESREY
jgi:hypothetical protein